MDMEARRRVLHGAADRDVGVAGIFRMDSALETHFRSAALPSLERTAVDLRMIEIVGPTTQVLAQLAFREGAELAAEIADVRVVDIAIDDIADAVAGHRRAQPIRRLADPLEIPPARREEPDDVTLEEFVPRARAFDDGLDRRPSTSQPRSVPIRRW